VTDIYVIGAGGHGAVVAELAAMVGCCVVGFVDDNPALLGNQVLDWQVVGGIDSVPDGAAVALGIGNNAVRYDLLRMASERNWRLPVMVHPSAAVSASAELGEGTVLLAQTAVNARARIGRGCILNTGCSVDHDCVLGDCCHIAPGARLAGAVEVGEATLIGVGTSVLPCIRIGDRCTIGGGSVVTRAIPDGVTAYGNPARVQKKQPGVRLT